MTENEKKKAEEEDKPPPSQQQQQQSSSRRKLNFNGLLQSCGGNLRTKELETLLDYAVIETPCTNIPAITQQQPLQPQHDDQEEKELIKEPVVETEEEQPSPTQSTRQHHNCHHEIKNERIR